jgi:hypothetical protein
MKPNIDKVSNAESSQSRPSLAAPFWDEPVIEIEITGRFPRWLPTALQVVRYVLVTLPWYLAAAGLAAHLAFITAGGD